MDHRFDFGLLIDLENGQLSQFLTGTLPLHAIQGFLQAVDRLHDYIPQLRITVNDQVVKELVILADGCNVKGAGEIEEVPKFER